MEQNAIWWNIARDESRPAKERGQALAELAYRKDLDAFSYVLNELNGEQLKKEWLHQLLFIAEHIPWEEPSERASARRVLLSVARHLFSDFREQPPDARDPSRVSQDEVAIWTALRTYGRLIAPEDQAALNHLLDFTEPQWINICQTCIQAMGDFFQAHPPTDQSSYKQIRDRLHSVIDLQLKSPEASQDASRGALLDSAVQALATSGDRRLLALLKQLKGAEEKYRVDYMTDYMADQLTDILNEWNQSDSGVSRFHPAFQQLEEGIGVLRASSSRKPGR